MSVLGAAALGVDVSDGTLKAVLLRRRGRRVTLLRTWRAPLPPRAGPEALAEAVAALLRRARPGAGTRLVLSAPAEDSVTRTYRLPVVDSARRGELVRYELLSELDLAGDDLVLGHIARRGLGEQPVHAYALKRARLEALQAACGARGIHPDAWELPGWALASALEHERPAARDRVLLGVGRQATDLVLLTEVGLWARHLDVGLDHLPPEALAARLRAELDASVGGLLPADQAFRPVQALLLEDGAGQARLAGALKKSLGVDVVRLDALQRTASAWRLAHDGQSPEQALSAARALGLALSGLGLARFACPAAGGDPRREAQRLAPGATLAALLAAGTLLVLVLQAQALTRELQRTLPIALAGELRDRARDALEKRQAVEAARLDSEALLALARRRAAALAPRTVLAVVSEVAAERAGHALHVDRLWLSTGSDARKGLLALTLVATPTLDDQLGDRLRRGMRLAFPEVAVHGPEAAGELSQWTVEIALP